MGWKNQEAKEEAYKLMLMQQKALLEGEKIGRAHV